MSAHIIDGKAIAAEINRETAERAAQLKAAGITPGLAVILVGDDPASQVYVRNKVRTCGEVGIVSRQITMPEDVTTADVIYEIEKLNNLMHCSSSLGRGYSPIAHK